MKMRNNSGANTVPCGTPERTEEGLLLTPYVASVWPKRELANGNGKLLRSDLVAIWWMMS